MAKVIGMMEAAWDAFCKYVQTAELLHKPWDMIFCKGTLLTNAKVVPERIKIWKPWPVVEIFLWFKTAFTASLIWVSISRL